MAIKCVIVEPEGTARETEIENSLGAFQAVVGGYIRPVSGRVATIYVNEEGLLTGLPPNPLASLFAQQILEAGVILHGTALIVGPADEEGNDTDVRPNVVNYWKMED